MWAATSEPRLCHRVLVLECPVLSCGKLASVIVMKEPKGRNRLLCVCSAWNALKDGLLIWIFFFFFLGDVETRSHGV